MTLDYARPAEPIKPGVLPWFTAYSLLMALLYLLCLIAGLLMMFNLSQQDEDWVMGIILSAIGLPLTVAFGIAPFLPRRPWVWIYDIVLICVGLTSVCTMPASIPLLIFWLKPETKVWFGKA